MTALLVRMKIANLAACSFVLCLALPSAWAAVDADSSRHVLDLETCVRQALESSHELHGAEYLLDAAQAVASRARAQKWPTLGIAGSYDFTSEITTIDFPGVPGLSERQIRLGDENKYVLALGVEVPVFTGGRLSAGARAEGAGARAAAYDLEAERLRIAHDVRAAFFLALGAQARKDAAAAATARLERHLRYLRGQVEVGAASREMRIQAEARLISAQRQELVAEDELATSQLLLGNLLDRPGERITPAGGLDRSQVEDYDLEDAGVDGKPELAALSSRYEQSRHRTRAARGSLFPSVSAGAYMNYGRPGVDLVQNEWMSWTSAGISVSWMLWDWGARRDEVRRAEATAQVLEARSSELNRELENALAVARTRLDLATAQLNKAQVRVELERQRIELVTGRYGQGMASETELLDVHDDLAEAEALLASSLAAVRLAEADLIYAIGR